ncbi:MAG: 50S ribosomal protein L16 [Candidatus Cyclonatronum sp.]|uniref:50S ribosomal protein L16 n=1 Tax=Cyclonatronum sp. TaxID=3024185 RepID=UPI0025BD22DF|nr:50S ribosomal protein L16 [Cyclonatronum sp.]MCC5934998.1 50S ribosomal protein L16 [Balneolales bacterium]MCH8487456.1 50S ribosomal protein L16 [Cyclonatronum sp.]
MLEPKRVKRRRVHKGRIKGNAGRGHKIAFGDFAIKSLEPKYITARQIEACRIAISRKMSREGQIWIRIFPDKPVTSKPAETRMGKGKGALDHFVAVVHPGTILFEVTGVSQKLAYEALRLAQFKLPVKTKLLTRRDYNGS